MIAPDIVQRVAKRLWEVSSPNVDSVYGVDLADAEYWTAKAQAAIAEYEAALREAGITDARDAIIKWARVMASTIKDYGMNDALVKAIADYDAVLAAAPSPSAEQPKP